MVVQACNPRAQEGEAELYMGGQPRLQRLSPTKADGAIGSVGRVLA